MKLKSTLLLASGMLVMNTSFGQYLVKTGGQKYTLVEESTGPGCGYCPDGAQDIEQSIEPTASLRAIIASWHDSYYDHTDMVVSGNPFSSIAAYITGDPMATIDRYPFGGSVVGQDRPWGSYVTTRSTSTPKFDVTMRCRYLPHTTSDTGTIIIKVTAKSLSALTGNWNTNVFVVEDSISSAAANFQQHSYLTADTTACNGQPNWFFGLGSIIPAASYSHMNVVRAVLATGGSIFGDVAFTSPASNDSFSKTYTFKFDTTLLNPKYMKVIGMVQKPGPASATAGNIIENVMLSKVRLMPSTFPAAVNDIPKEMLDVTLYPNPSKNMIIVKGTLSEPSETTIQICNSIGQVMQEKVYPTGGSLFGQIIETSSLANGQYFMTITNEGQKVVKEFVVNR
jgi:hypothetical protein